MKPTDPRTVYSWRAKIISWIDGDTVWVEIDRGFDDRSWRTMRINGIDAPDAKRADPESKKRRDAAKAFAESLAPSGEMVQLQSVKGKDSDKYGRYLAQLTLRDGRDFATVMIQAGHAVAYHGGKR